MKPEDQKRVLMFQTRIICFKLEKSNSNSIGSLPLTHLSKKSLTSAQETWYLAALLATTRRFWPTVRLVVVRRIRWEREVLAA
jgi:hypothetical protein